MQKQDYGKLIEEIEKLKKEITILHKTIKGIKPEILSKKDLLKMEKLRKILNNL
ncbi:MAG TPA: hypothetical protein PL066_00520 [bacterium]|nr:hypothetical protein [bacterium]